MASGRSSTSSLANALILSGFPAAHRSSICKFLPSVHPNCASAFRYPSNMARADASLSANDISTPIRRLCSACCACAASGHVAAAPPIRVINSRRFIRSLLPNSDEQRGYHTNEALVEMTASYVRSGSKDGVIGRPSLWIAEEFWALRFRLMVKRGSRLRPQASEGEAQHGPFCWIRRIGQGDQHLHCG